MRVNRNRLVSLGLVKRKYRENNFITEYYQKFTNDEVRTE